MITSRRHLSQTGSVLVITLLVLLMLTIMAVAEISFNSTQTRVATNSADAQVAFQTAEGALNEATNNLLAGQYPSTGFLANTNGLYLFNPTNNPLWSTIDWTNANAVIRSFQGSSSAQAAFFIELLPSVIKGGQNINTPTQVFRITARAVGASGNSPVILQSTLQLQ